MVLCLYERWNEARGDEGMIYGRYWHSLCIKRLTKAGRGQGCQMCIR